MAIKATYRVLGVKGSKGTMESGFEFDSCKLRVEMPVSSKSGTEFGFDAYDMFVGKAEELAKFKDLPFPIMAELEVELTTKGYECVGFKPIGQSKDRA